MFSCSLLALFCNSIRLLCVARTCLKVQWLLTVSLHKICKLAWWSMRNTHKAGIPILASHCLHLITHMNDTLFFFTYSVFIFTTGSGSLGSGELLQKLGGERVNFCKIEELFSSVLAEKCHGSFQIC